MNDALAPARFRDWAPLLIPAAEANGRRLTVAARLELRLGVWLLLRGARQDGDAPDQARHAANARSLSARHHDALRAHALNSVRT